MAMTRTEATYVHVLLTWLMGGEGPTGAPYTGEDARYAAAVLAKSAAKVKTAGVSPQAVQVYFDTAAPRVLPTPGKGVPLAPEAADLLAAVWCVMESDGSWPGGDTVEAVAGWLAAQGANTLHPAQRDPDGSDTDDGPVSDARMSVFDEYDGDEAALRVFALAHGHDQYAPPAPVDEDDDPDEDGQDPH